MNGRYGSMTYDSRVPVAIEKIGEMDPDLVVCTGDMVAGQKQPGLDADRLDQMWRGFNRTIADPLKRRGIPFFVTPGNHDGSGFPEFALEREHFEIQWAPRVPEVEMLVGSEWPRRYAARVGDELLIAFDGTVPGALSEDEFRFVEKMLHVYGKGPEATIVFSHLPMWPLTSGREHEIIDDPALLELLHDNGVDVYASGHHHAFFAGTDDAGMVHLGLGALGGNARPFSGKKQRQPFSFSVLTLSNGMVDIASRAAPDFDAEVPVSELPATIEGPLGVLRRMDAPVRLRP